MHGGSFCLYSTSSSIYHNYLNSLVSEAQVIAVSPDFKPAPDYPIPTCYDDSWAVTQWAASHASRAGPDPWLNQWADFGRVYLAGDSSGANIAHEMVIRAGPSGLLGPSARVAGLPLIQPYFGDKNEWENALWACLCGTTTVGQELRLNPRLDAARVKERLGCGRVLVCVGGKDIHKRRGVNYCELLLREGWKGELEIWESHGKGHAFHLKNPECVEAKQLLTQVSLFVRKPTSHL